MHTTLNMSCVGIFLKTYDIEQESSYM